MSAARGGVNSGIDSVLANADPPSRMQIVENVDLDGVYAVVPSAAPPRDPAEAARERSHPVEALASDIILALRSDYRVFVEALTATESEGSEEDYGDSDDELDVEDERGEAEIVVTSRALRYINPDQGGTQLGEAQVPNHEDVSIMLERAAGAPGGAHTMNTALEVPQPGETEVVSVMEPIIQQEEQEDSSAPQKQVEKDASESSIVGSPSSSPCI